MPQNLQYGAIGLGVLPGVLGALEQDANGLLRRLGHGEVFDALFTPQRHQIVIEVFAERPIGVPEEFEVQPLQRCAEHLQLAQKSQLLEFDIAQEAMGLHELQEVQ